MVSWGTVWTLTTLFGIPVFRYLKGQYYQIRAAGKNGRVPVVPVPPRIARCLNILFFTCLAFLAASTQYVKLTPENIFQTTGSRLTTPTVELFDRLAAIRPLTPLDEGLRARFGSKDARLLYAAYGPDAIANCPFCRSDDPNSFFYYSILGIIVPHIFNLGILGLVTSSGFAGGEGSRFRLQATIGGMALLFVDLYLLGQYDPLVTANVRQLQTVRWFFWEMRTYRSLAFAISHGLLCATLWLTSTNRWLAQAPSVSSRLQEISKHYENVRNQFQALVMLRNTVMRTPALRERTVDYWTQEEQVMKELREDPEVMEAVNGAITSIPPENLQTMTQSASGAMNDLLRQIEGMRQRT